MRRRLSSSACPRAVVHRDEVKEEVGGVELRGAREPDGAEEGHGALGLAEEHYLPFAQGGTAGQTCGRCSSGAGGSR